jgi:hypothetical protein
MARTPALANLSAADLNKELARRQRMIRSLHGKRDKAAKVLAALDAEIRRLGGGGRKRPANDGSLVEHLGAVLKGKVMGVEEAAEAVLKRGYRSGARNFRLIVNQAIIKSGDKFKRVGRGRYTGK